MKEKKKKLKRRSVRACWEPPALGQEWGTSDAEHLKSPGSAQSLPRAPRRTRRLCHPQRLPDTAAEASVAFSSLEQPKSAVQDKVTATRRACVTRGPSLCCRAAGPGSCSFAAGSARAAPPGPLRRPHPDEPGAPARPPPPPGNVVSQRKLDVDKTTCISPKQLCSSWKIFGPSGKQLVGNLRAGKGDIVGAGMQPWYSCDCCNGARFPWQRCSSSDADGCISRMHRLTELSPAPHPVPHREKKTNKKIPQTSLWRESSAPAGGSHARRGDGRHRSSTSARGRSASRPPVPVPVPGERGSTCTCLRA